MQTLKDLRLSFLDNYLVRSYITSHVFALHLAQQRRLQPCCKFCQAWKLYSFKVYAFTS